jgi:hypothetical protein
MDKLKPCPFCGSYPKVKHIGNDYTKKRSIEISCPKCRIKRTDNAFRFSFAWLEYAAVRNWNKRTIAKRNE